MATRKQIRRKAIQRVQRQIRTKLAQLRKEGKRASRQKEFRLVRVLRRKIRRLQRKCSHPNEKIIVLGYGVEHINEDTVIVAGTNSYRICSDCEKGHPRPFGGT